MVAQSLLAASGIEATLADEYAGTLGPQFVPWGMRLQIPDEDAERALKILDGEGAPEWNQADVTPDATAPMEHEVEAPSTRRERFDWRGFLPRSDSKWVFILAMVAYARILQSTLQYFIEPLIGSNLWMQHVIGWGPVLSNAAEAVVFAPIWETLLLVGIIELFRWVRKPVFIQVLLSTVALGVVDGFHWWPHGVVVLPFFLLCAVSYLYWRAAGWRTAMGIVILIHAVSNCVPTTWLVLKQVDRDRASLNATGYAGNWARADKLYMESYAELENHSTADAIDKLQQAVNLYPYDARYHVRLGSAFEQADRLNEAEAELRKAISLDESDWMAWEGLGRVLNTEKRLTASLGAYHTALDAAPPYARSRLEAWINAITPEVSGTSL
jgi:hypothetical protein